jgi:hypothetical protein
MSKLIKLNRGFIGPIGDDLPSLIMIVLALTLFFSGVLFCLNAYNQKIDNANLLTGAMDISRAVTINGLVSNNLVSEREKARDIAQSYGLKYDVYFAKDSPVNCPEDSNNRLANAHTFGYLVAKLKSSGDIVLDTLIIRTCT